MTRTRSPAISKGGVIIVIGRCPEEAQCNDLRPENPIVFGQQLKRPV